MKGPVLLLAGIVLFSLLDANSKLLSGGYGLGQVVATRYAVLLALLLLARLAFGGAGGSVGTSRPGLHLLRAASMMVSAAGFFLAFRQLPLAEGYLVFFTAPFMTLALSAAVLREVVPRAAWFWCAVGFGGVVLAVLPKLGGDGGPVFGYLAVLAGTLGFAVTQTVNRSLRGEPGVARILFWPSLLGLLLYGPLALWYWVPPPAPDLAMLMANGLVAGAAVVATAAAFRHADAARLGPFGFAALPVSVLLDLAIWGHPPDPAMLAGGAVVVLACVMSERAARLAKGQGVKAQGKVQGIPAGKAWAPSAPSGSGAVERTAASGSGP
ncbi:DMT family transporter [Siccirubricoccus sp. G192]|uniref:DMT family transporter n=1 Tax=Siccirubricoccus sp. G192 TaxID=2849651 RepID=UPI002811767D|nr:DMT family transporter [Siccirubricoccus sp. G192]